MKHRPEATGSAGLDVDEVSILLIGSEEEQNQAIRLLDRHLRRAIVATIRRTALSLPSSELPDVYQDVLLSILKVAREKQYDADKPLLPFVLTVAHRRAVDWIRRSRHERANEAELLEAVADSLAGTTVGEAWQQAAGDEESRRLLEAMRTAIARMPERQRQVASVVIDLSLIHI